MFDACAGPRVCWRVGDRVGEGCCLSSTPHGLSVGLVAEAVSGLVAGEAQGEQDEESGGGQPVPVRLEGQQVAGLRQREFEAAAQARLAHADA